MKVGEKGGMDIPQHTPSGIHLGRQSGKLCLVSDTPSIKTVCTYLEARVRRRFDKNIFSWTVQDALAVQRLLKFVKDSEDCAQLLEKAGQRLLDLPSSEPKRGT